MAELAGIFAASHGPMIVRNRDILTPEERDGLEVPNLSELVRLEKEIA